MKRRDFIKNSMAAPGFMLLDKFEALAQTPFSMEGTNELVSRFQKAYGPCPYTFWQWIDGCVTKEGITYDLEAFKNAGINDVQQFLIGGSEADIADPDVPIMGDRWIELMRFALDECQRLGMTFGTHNCPGWSASGAQGMQPEDSMQKLVWTKTLVKSKDSFTKIIPQFKPDAKWNFYKDICVIALPSGTETITKDDVLVFQDNLTSKNHLRQKLPAGEWLILRIGHTTTGNINGTAPISGQGLEVDKMSKEALDKFWALYPAKLIEIAGHHVGTTLKRLESDSFEAGEQTWTKKMIQEFEQRNGYNILPWLPVLAGFTIDNKDVTDRFKYDWQQTINSLFAENYYDHLNTLINKAGMEYLIEPYGTGHINFDTSSIRGIGDLLMCEFWWGPTTWGWDSIFPVASNAHVNGKKIVAAESFTAQPQFAWKVDLFDLKPVGDRAFCNGVNLFVFHASAHQPWPHVKPGMTMGWWGTQFGPSQTWWDHGAPEWIEYLNRCQLILQKGMFVADVCFLHLYKQRNPLVPDGYKADVCNAKEFLERFDIEENKWILPDGMNYKVLVLSNDCALDLTLARKIEQLVNKGGVILGGGFKGTLSLKEFDENEEVVRISKSLFGTSSSSKISFDKQMLKVGKGKVYTGYSLDEVLKLEKIAKDLESPDDAKDILWIHRKENNENYYFISNQANEVKELRLSFRITDMLPELWDAETGAIINAPVWETTKNRIMVSLNLDAYGSIFVVFRVSTSVKHGITALKVGGKSVNPLNYLSGLDGNRHLFRFGEPGDYVLFAGARPILNKMQTSDAIKRVLNDDWYVSFQKDRGAPSTPVLFNRLISFSDHDNKNVKYFSGKAIYRRSFSLNENEMIPNKAIFIDLGVVKNVATILINGKNIKTFWKPPFTLEVSQYCMVGNNILEVEVTNLWPNRMIGDEAEPDDLLWGGVRFFKYVNPNPKIGRNLQKVPDWVKQNNARPSKDRVTFSIIDFFDKDDPLLPSGLIGPVELSVEDVIKIY